MTEKEQKTGRLVLLLLAALAVALGGFWFPQNSGPPCSVIQVDSSQKPPFGPVEDRLPAQQV